MKYNLENLLEKYDVQTNDDVQFRKDLLELFNKEARKNQLQNDISRLDNQIIKNTVLKEKLELLKKENTGMAADESIEIQTNTKSTPPGYILLIVGGGLIFTFNIISIICHINIPHKNIYVLGYIVIMIVYLLFHLKKQIKVSNINPKDDI